MELLCGVVKKKTIFWTVVTLIHTGYATSVIIKYRVRYLSHTHTLTASSATMCMCVGIGAGTINSTKCSSSHQKQHQWIGYICAIIAIAFFGSNFVPVKKYDTGDGTSTLLLLLLLLLSLLLLLLFDVILLLLLFDVNVF